ncbi:MAG: hypothetical protein ACI4R8_02100 [Candidatus Caccovivens sp.]
MRKQEYIQRAKQAIINRVRFHAPIVYDDNIDKRVLFENGVDLSLPIFKFDKILNKRLAKAFELAQNEEKFNLVLSTSSLGNGRLKVPNAIVYSPQNSSTSFVEMINKLNINYSASTNYQLLFKDKFMKINEEIINPQYDEFVLKTCLVKDDIWISYDEFVLNGSNFFVKIKNMGDKDKKVSLELNIPLEKGYYYFKKLNRSILVENLLSKQKLFLNFVCRNAKFSFSNVNGLENSTYCCINIRLSINLCAGEEKFVFFNLSQAKFTLSNKKEVERFKELAKVKSCEIFDVKVKTKNPKFDLFFNKTLPQKIWLNWLNGQFDEKLEEKYLTFKRMFIKGSEQLTFVPFHEIGLKEIAIFNGEYYKKIYYINGSQKFLKVGKTCFYNVNSLTQVSLKSKEPICVCFGE